MQNLHDIEHILMSISFASEEAQRLFLCHFHFLNRLTFFLTTLRQLVLIQYQQVIIKKIQSDYLGCILLFMITILIIINFLILLQITEIFKVNRIITPFYIYIYNNDCLLIQYLRIQIKSEYKIRVFCKKASYIYLY